MTTNEPGAPFVTASVVTLLAEIRDRLAPDRPLLLDQEGAWSLLGLSRTTFFALKSAGKLPAPVELPAGGIMYRRADLERWAEKLKTSRRVRSVPTPSAN